MRPSYRRWLEQQGSSENTIRGRISETSRLESYYGDLDALYLGDRLAGLISNLCYSTDDQRRRRPNPTKIPIDGDLRNNLATYKSAVELYRKFRDAEGDSALPDESQSSKMDPPQSADEEENQRIGLERDMQAALRREISQMESGLNIVDEGMERRVDSGFIDITARVGRGAAAIRGILVAHDFDAKAVPHRDLGMRFHRESCPRVGWPAFGERALHGVGRRFLLSSSDHAQPLHNRAVQNAA